MAEARTPGFLRYFLLQENLLRYLTPDYGDLHGGAHVRPPGFVWVLLAVALLPWSLVAVSALTKHARERGRQGLGPAERFLLAWGLSSPLFFTPARSVLMSYVLPSLPALCLLLAHLVARPADPERPPATPLALTLGPLARRSALGAAVGLALAVAALDLSTRLLLADKIGARLSARDLVSTLEMRRLERCDVLFFGPYSARFYADTPPLTLEKNPSVLASHRADGRCHVLVLRAKDLRQLPAASLEGLRQVYAGRFYRAWTDRPATPSTAQLSRGPRGERPAEAVTRG